jgi:hypothetical protein
MIELANGEGLFHYLSADSGGTGICSHHPPFTLFLRIIYGDPLPLICRLPVVTSTPAGISAVGHEFRRSVFNRISPSE